MSSYDYGKDECDMAGQGKSKRRGDASESKERTSRNRKAKSSAGAETLPLPPCKVCGGKSSGFHFGVITCEACKTFFRRALTHKQTYTCLGNNECNVADIHKRLTNCSACRLQKCHSLGMSKSSVRKGRFSIETRTRTIVEAKAVLVQDPFLTIAPRQPVPPEEHPSVSTSNTKTTIDNAPSPAPSHSIADSMPLSPLQALFEEDAAASSVLCGHQALPLSCQPLVCNGELEMLIETIVSCQDAVYPEIRKHLQFTKEIHYMQMKTYEDFKLKKEVFRELFGSIKPVSIAEYKHIFAETGLDLDDRLSHFNQKGKAMEESINQFANFTKIIPGFRNICPYDISHLMKAAHLEFWMFGNYMLYSKELSLAISWDGSHNATKEDMAKFFNIDWIEPMFAYTDTLQRLELSIEEIALLRAIVLTFTDRCELKNADQISALQEKYLDCLRYLLSKTYENPNTRLYKLIDRLLAIRDLSHINVKVNQEFLEEWGFVIDDYPLWKEMLSFKDI
ncbi:nuclear receptor ROR-beta-like isoform X2 [Dreissena polymorpha]|nr:nuclear receptor ROR-beta-like isoform X2 [Dreissena polymorpha]